MSLHVRPMGPRSKPSSSNFKELPPVPPSSTQNLLPPEPLIVNKRPKTPKLRLPLLNTAPQPLQGEDYSYYGQIPSVSVSNEQPASRDDDPSHNHRNDDKTLRPPMHDDSHEYGSFRMDQIRNVIDGLERRPESRMRSRERDSLSSEHARSNSQPTMFDDEKWSDDVLVVTDRLGEGAGGAVFKVVDRRTGNIYARKTIPTRTTPAKQLLAELRHLSGSKHDNICEFYGAYMSPSSSEVNVVMELCEGRSLEAISKKIRERNGRIAEQLIGKLGEGILKGLTHLHSLKIIHRDIKPSNILLSLAGIVKLCDFGVSGELEDSMVVTFTGTSWYMAPERVNGKSYSVRADVWSTGLSLLELAQNRFPLPDDLDGIIPLMDYITRGPPIRLQDDDDIKWSDGAKDFIRQCLRVSPADRPYPGALLRHPWVLECSQAIKDKTVASWVRTVWGIAKPVKVKKHGASRPVSRQEPNEP